MDASDKVKQVRDKTIYNNLQPIVSALKYTFKDYEIKAEYYEGQELYLDGECPIEPNLVKSVKTVKAVNPQKDTKINVSSISTVTTSG